VAITGEPQPPAPARAGSLATRLVWATLIFCLGFTLLAFGIRAWSARQAHRDTMNAELTQLGEVSQRTLAKSIWEMDREALRAQVDSAANVASVGHVTLTIRLAGRPAEVLERRREGWAASDRAPSLVRELTYEPYAGARETVGSFSLDGDARVLEARLRDEIVGIALTQVVQSLLLAGLVMWMFNRSVTVHVRHIAGHLARLTPQSLGEPLRLERPAARQDELSLLAAGVNQLQGSLSNYLERQHRDERELAAHRDRLADLVQERTQALQAANDQLQALSRSDALTGLPNRRHFDDIKDLEFRRALRTKQPLSLLIADVDHFKRYNDHYGHAAGDQCLREIAGVLMACFGRAGELAARYGGEEFAVLLPATDAAGALGAAQRLRDALAARALPHEDSDVAPQVTLSIGAAQFDAATMDSFETLFHQADQALYRAKRHGRDRAEI